MAEGLRTSIDHSSPIPYYAQLMAALRDAIEGRVWEPGEQMPSEAELCELFELSRTPVRQALDELEREGLISRIKGKGTFVAEPKISEGLVQELTGFFQDMVDRGHTPVTEVLKREVVPAAPKIAGYLGVEPGTHVYEIERLRSINDEPIVLVTTYLPHALCPELTDADLRTRSLYAYLEETCGLVITRGRRIIEAVPASKYEAKLLEVEVGAPLILLDSVSYLRDGTPVEYYHALHRGDRSRFEVELVRIREQGDLREVLAADAVNLPRSNDLLG
jgi:GntR family transcriptional regulator